MFKMNSYKIIKYQHFLKAAFPISVIFYMYFFFWKPYFWQRTYVQRPLTTIRQLNQKREKVLNTHFIKENIQMTNKHMKRYSTSFIFREMEIKTTGNHFIPITMLVQYMYFLKNSSKKSVHSTGNQVIGPFTNTNLFRIWRGKNNQKLSNIQGLWH